MHCNPHTLQENGKAACNTKHRRIWGQPESVVCGVLWQTSRMWFALLRGLGLDQGLTLLEKNTSKAKNHSYSLLLCINQYPIHPSYSITPYEEMHASPPKNLHNTKIVSNVCIFQTFNPPFPMFIHQCISPLHPYFYTIES
jgi:hypothetical protein